MISNIYLLRLSFVINFCTGKINIATIPNRIANKQYGNLRPIRSSIRCTTIYASNSTNALRAKDKYGLNFHEP